MNRPEWGIALWDAINSYVEACGGDTSARTVSEERERAVTAIEDLVMGGGPPRMHWRLAEGAAAMTELAGMFPSFRRRDVPGISPWEPRALVHWLNTSGAPTSGSRHAALFLLSIWNREDWSDRRIFAPDEKPLRIRRGKNDVRRIGRFDLSDAWAVWDEGHRRAALAWLVDPFFP